MGQGGGREVGKLMKNCCKVIAFVDRNNQSLYVTHITTPKH